MPQLAHSLYPTIEESDPEEGGTALLLTLHPLPQGAWVERRVKEQIMPSPLISDPSRSDL